MAYNWWVFLHLIGVFGFLAAHGLSMVMAIRLRRERDPAKVNDLLQLSSASTRVFYVFFILLGVGGIVAASVAHLWSQAWVWLSVIVLVVILIVMYALASPFYKKVGVIARAKAGGSKAVSDKQFDTLLLSRVPGIVMGIGTLGLVALIYLMLFKPTFASSTPAPPVAVPSGSVPSSVIHQTAGQLSFGTSTMQAPANTQFQIVFDNQAPGVQHNVSIYTNSSASHALFQGQLVAGPKTITYHVGALPAGTYFFRCDVHPAQMTGTLVVK
jgi:plastocyanin